MQSFAVCMNLHFSGAGDCKLQSNLQSFAVMCSDQKKRDERMNTKELAARLADLKAMSDQNQSAFNAPLAKAFNGLQAELQPDGLEICIDENWQFLVRQRLTGKEQ